MRTLLVFLCLVTVGFGNPLCDRLEEMQHRERLAFALGDVRGYLFWSRQESILLSRVTDRVLSSMSLEELRRYEMLNMERATWAAGMSEVLGRRMDAARQQESLDVQRRQADALDWLSYGRCYRDLIR